MVRWKTAITGKGGGELLPYRTVITHPHTNYALFDSRAYLLESTLV
jgi:hypothetical protein